MKVSRFLPVLLLLLYPFFTACSLSHDTPLPDYLKRLGRSLDRAIDPTPSELVALPRGRELKIGVMPGSVDLLDMFALNDCQLNVTIGKSNSSLGKLASSSQRLLLELEFLSLAPACIELLDSRDRSELAATLRRGLAEKRRQLPMRIWNATLAGPEFREFWQRTASLDGYPGATGTAVPAALEELVLLLRRWLNGDYEAGRDRLETLLATIRRGDGGRLLSALETQHNGLASGTEAVRQRLTDPPLCYRKRPSPQGLIFETVIRKYFIGEVQPWSVQIARRVQLLGEPIARLEKMLEDVTPPAYRDWRRYRDSLMSSGVEAPRQHALAVAELLDVCGLRPG